jgi:hypothetical protein
MRCQTCHFMSHDYNYQCPNCGSNLTRLRKQLGLTEEPPEIQSLESFFGAPITIPEIQVDQPTDMGTTHEVQLLNDLADDEDFEFDLDN